MARFIISAFAAAILLAAATGVLSSHSVWSNGAAGRGGMPSLQELQGPARTERLPVQDSGSLFGVSKGNEAKLAGPIRRGDDLSIRSTSPKRWILCWIPKSRLRDVSVSHASGQARRGRVPIPPPANGRASSGCSRLLLGREVSGAVRTSAVGAYLRRTAA
jgi:hypothetical protein